MKTDDHYQKLASLTLHAHRSDAEREAIARWLEAQARALREEGAEYRQRFTAGYWEHRRAS